MSASHSSAPAALLLDLARGALRLTPGALICDHRFDSATLPQGWHIETGSWTPTVDGLVGSIEGDSAAVLWSGDSYPDDVAMVFEATSMPGHHSDANGFFRAAGSIYGDGLCEAWIVGTAGWYAHDHGLEHHPTGPTWRVPGQPLVPEQTVKVAAGYRNGVVFLWKDGEVLLERDDPHATAAVPRDRLGLGTWDSAVRFTRLSVYDLSLCPDLAPSPDEGSP